MNAGSLLMYCHCDKQEVFDLFCEITDKSDKSSSQLTDSRLQFSDLVTVW